MYPKASEIIMYPDLPGSSITTLLKTAHFYWFIMIIKDGERPFEQHQNRSDFCLQQSLFNVITDDYRPFDMSFGDAPVSSKCQHPRLLISGEFWWIC